MAADGFVKVASNAKVYGLTLLTKNAYKDETYGETGMHGSRKTTVVKRGVVDIGASIFVLDDHSEIAVYPYNNALEYAVNDKLYVETATGLITNVVEAENANINTYLGDVVMLPYVDVAGDTVMQIDLKC